MIELLLLGRPDLNTKRKLYLLDILFKFTGWGLQVHWEGHAGSIEINGTIYALKQAHWHSPSEHTINKKR
ncbi:putative carbonic anhydrase [Helianthus debilis subsp. tardiflorus]